MRVRAYVIVLLHQPASQPDRFLISNLSACAVCAAVQSEGVCCAALWRCLMQPTSSPPCPLCLCLHPSVVSSSRLFSHTHHSDLPIFYPLPVYLSHPPSPPHVYVHARHTAAAPFHAISAASSLAYPPLPLSRPNSLSIAKLSMPSSRAFLSSSTGVCRRRLA